MAADACVPPDATEIAAPLLLGFVWNWGLYGMLVVQVYVYSYYFPKDRTLVKVLVYGIFFLETLQTILSGADLYYWFVEGFGNMKHLATPYASPYDTPVVGAIIAMAVQFFFSYRIWVMTVVDTAALVAVTAFPDKDWWTCPVAVLGKLYSNALLVSFNNRISIRDASSSSRVMTFGSRGFGINSTNPQAEDVVLNDMGATTSEDREIKAESLRGADETKRVPQFINIV
ncbi:hypothetical protein BC834DRAFT_972340 [Gloeopeniophorella convolvens]|nr:hypothetical protein BC834DRAFT_972340 [Gloeopeniophorella convolvens]